MKQPARPYLQHARRHDPLTGSDPLPESPYLFASSAAITLTSGSTGAAVDYDPSGGITWGTEQGASTPSGWFDLRDPGSGTFELAILRHGLYLIDIAAVMDSGSAPAAGSAGEVAISNTAYPVGGSPVEPWLATPLGSPAYSVQPSLRAVLNWPVSAGSPPFFHGISIYQNSGLSIANIDVDFIVRLYNSGNSGF